MFSFLKKRQIAAALSAHLGRPATAEEVDEAFEAAQEESENQQDEQREQRGYHASVHLAGVNPAQFSLPPAERAELEQLRKQRDESQARASTQAREFAAMRGDSIARKLLKLGRITPEQEKPVALAFGRLAALSVTDGIPEGFDTIGFATMGEDGQLTQGSANLFDLFAGLVENGPAHSMDKEVVPQGAQVAALFTRTKTPEKNVDGTAQKPIAKDRISRMVHHATGSPMAVSTTYVENNVPDAA